MGKKHFYERGISSLSDIESYIEEFIERKKIDSISPSTIKGYEESLDKFNDFIHGKIRLKEYHKEQIIDQDIIDDYKRHLLNKYNNPATINNRITSLKTLLGYLASKKIVADDILIKKVPCSQIKETYTIEEVKRLLIKPKKASFEEFRAWVLINFVLGCPLRLNALNNIKWSNIVFNNIEDSFIVIQAQINKTGRDDSFHLPPTLVLVLLDYKRRMSYKDDDYVFTKYDKSKLAYMSLQKSIGNYCINRGVKKTSLHLFRHFVAKEAVLAGSPELLLMRMLGHKTLKMSSHYANIFGKISPEMVKSNALELLKKR